MTFLSGAGGNWPVIGEASDQSAIRQRDNLCCGPACAVMLLKGLGIDNVNQDLIASLSGVPVALSDLARTLNELDTTKTRRWLGGGLRISGATATELLFVLVSMGAWIAEMREPMARLGHLVVVDAMDKDEFLEIRDPWNGTRYRMRLEDFLNYWTLRGIYAIRL